MQVLRLNRKSNNKIFQLYSDKGNNIIKSYNPLKSIEAYKEKLIKEQIPNKNFHLNFFKFQEMKKYRTLMFLNRELQFEITKSKNFIISHQLNSEMLAEQYTYNEDNKYLYLHKQNKDFYIIIQFSKLKPLINEKKKDMIKNQAAQEWQQWFIKNDILEKLSGLENNAEYLATREIESGKVFIEDEYKDEREIKFTINLLNKKSECIKIYCKNKEQDVI